MKTLTNLLVFLLVILFNNLFAEQYKANGEITINTLGEWQNTGNWVRIAGGNGYPTNNDEIVLTSNARLNINLDLKSNNINLYLTFEDDGFIEIKSDGALLVLGSVVMDKNNVEMKVYGDLEIENNFQLDNGNLFVKDGGSLLINGNFLRSDIGSGQFEIGGETTSFTVEGDFDDQHNSPNIYNSPELNIKGSCSTKSGVFCEISLPVVLSALDVSYSYGNAIIAWTTSSEQNNKSFEIYRSIDLDQWVLIGVVEGQGNSDVSHDYQWIDTNLNSSEVIYYQLHQVDFDGSREVFETLTLNTKQHQSSLPNVMISTNLIRSGENVQIVYLNNRQSNNQVTIIYSDGKIKDCSNLSRNLIPNQLFAKGLNILSVSNGREKYSFKILK